MKVKLKDPSRVFYCKEQGKALTGKGSFDVKATGYIREQLAARTLEEVVVVEAPEAKEPEAKEPEVKLTPAQVKKAKEEAEAKVKKVEVS